MTDALAWATLPTGDSPGWLRMRMTVVRGFTAYLATRPVRRSAPASLLPGGTRRAVPYPCSPVDIAALFAQASELKTPLRQTTIKTLIGLLAVTGTRGGDVVALDDEDFDAGRGCLWAPATRSLCSSTSIATVRVAVIGAGVVGLSAAASLLNMDVEVVCFERSAAPMSERSAGSSRIFRLAHHNPDLVGLAQSARTIFYRWAEDASTPLIDPCGCVISGTVVTAWASAMEEAGAPYRIVDASPYELRLPAVALPAESLIDIAGGVVNVNAVRAYLVGVTRSIIVYEAVYALDADAAGGATVWSPAGKTRFDAVVIAAGAGTFPLAAQAGIETPGALAHHVRFTFPIDSSVAWRSWIDKPAVGLSTYQHRSGPGMWAIGGHVDPALTAWEVPRDTAAASSREAVLQLVRERLTIAPHVLDSLYCTTTSGMVDGFEVRRNGSVLAVYGENLFKLAPILGEVLATAACDDSAPSTVNVT